MATERLPSAINSPSPSDMHDHLAAARQKARDVLDGESHFDPLDDWRQCFLSARDGVMAVWLVWLSTTGARMSESVGAVLAGAGAAIAVYLGVKTAIATRLRLRHYERELERERREIAEQPEHEREEVLALYAAKGFREPLLSQIADTLCADDDRLLKVMMEEELGLSVQHMNHPLLVGLWNGAGAGAGGLLLAVPVCVQSSDFTVFWMPVATCATLILLAVANARSTGQNVIHVAARWLAVAAVAGGCARFVAAMIV